MGSAVYAVPVNLDIFILKYVFLWAQIHIIIMRLRSDKNICMRAHSPIIQLVVEVAGQAKLIFLHPMI